MNKVVAAKSPFLDVMLAALAMCGLAVSVFVGFSVKLSADAFSDLKTLYASTWCFAHGLNAYSLQNIQGVFARQGIVQPASWYGHAPIYPPTTLALIAPFCALPMAVAMYVITAISVLAFIAAIVSLLRRPIDSVTSGWLSKGILVSMCASVPLVGFALSCGNLSVLATALGILAFNPSSSNLWLQALSLALAILLKPHLAIWIGLCMFLLSGSRRVIAIRAAGMVVVFVAALSLWLAAHGNLLMQTHGLVAMVRAEAAAGASMSVSSHEVLPIEAQITSLQSVFGFWIGNHSMSLLLAMVFLILAACWLLRETFAVNTEEKALLAAGAWISFGLLATYHRAHDATALLILAPLLLNRLRKTPREWMAWTVICLFLAISLGLSENNIRHHVTATAQNSVLAFILLRQAGLAALALLMTLLVTLRIERVRYRATQPVRMFRRSHRIAAAHLPSIKTIPKTSVVPREAQTKYATKVEVS